MANKVKWVGSEGSDLLFSSITQKSKPRDIQGAEEKFSATFGLTERDFKSMLPIMMQCIREETGNFTGPNDYYLACMGGNTAAKRVMDAAEFKAQALRHQGKNDDAFRIMEKSEKRATVYRTYPGILVASSKFDIELGRLNNGAIVDIQSEADRARAGKELFYAGAKVVPSIQLQGFRRKKVDDRDGVTAFLQNVLWLRHGPKIDTGGGAPSNSEVFAGFKNYSDYDPMANAPGASTDDWNSGGSQQSGNGQQGGTQQNGNQGGDAWGSGQSGNGSGSTTQSPSNQGGGASNYQPQGGYQGSQGGEPDAAAW